MKKMINDNELNNVTGGSVILSDKLNVVGFSSTKEVYKLLGDFDTMRDSLIEMYGLRGDMNDSEFDEFVKQKFKANGWI